MGGNANKIQKLFSKFTEGSSMTHLTLRDAIESDPHKHRNTQDK